MKTLMQLPDEVGAEYIGNDVDFHGISIDTRVLKPRELFVAIRGAQVDGHSLIDQAIEKGASACLVDHKIDRDIPQIIAQDTRITLGLIAKKWREQFNIPFITVTGSCGKTTVKEMLGSILNQGAKALITQGNFNSDYGLPVTLGRLNQSYDYAVLEVGSNHLGEIKYLADIIQPDIAVITNVGAAHLEGFGSLDGVMKEKGELFQSLAINGIAIVNDDDPRIKTYAKSLNVQKITFSETNHNANVYLASEPLIKNGYLTFDVILENQKMTVELALWGRYQVKNALAVISVCHVLNIPMDIVLTGLKQLEQVQGRFMPIKLSERIQLIDDTYNASVPSVKAAIETLSQFAGKRIFVMGHMGELGDKAKSYHREMGEWLLQNAIDEVYLYGNYELLSNTLSVLPSARYYDDKLKLISDLKQSLSSDEQQTWVLVKGSRSTEMEHVIKDLVRP